MPVQVVSRRRRQCAPKNYTDQIKLAVHTGTPAHSAFQGAWAFDQGKKRSSAGDPGSWAVGVPQAAVAPPAHALRPCPSAAQLAAPLSDGQPLTPTTHAALLYRRCASRRRTAATTAAHRAAAVPRLEPACAAANCSSGDRRRWPATMRAAEAAASASRSAPDALPPWSSRNNSSSSSSASSTMASVVCRWQGGPPVAAMQAGSLAGHHMPARVLA
jgi:hypothetical protein